MKILATTPPNCQRFQRLNSFHPGFFKLGFANLQLGLFGQQITQLVLAGGFVDGAVAEAGSTVSS